MVSYSSSFCLYQIYSSLKSKRTYGFTLCWTLSARDSRLEKMKYHTDFKKATCCTRCRCCRFLTAALIWRHLSYFRFHRNHHNYYNFCVFYSWNITHLTIFVVFRAMVLRTTCFFLFFCLAYTSMLKIKVTFSSTSWLAKKCTVLYPRWQNSS